jgi:hypothetical protein
MVAFGKKLFAGGPEPEIAVAQAEVGLGLQNS